LEREKKSFENEVIVLFYKLLTCATAVGLKMKRQMTFNFFFFYSLRAEKKIGGWADVGRLSAEILL